LPLPDTEPSEVESDLTANSKAPELAIVAIDCEMVRTELGLELARVTVINLDHETLMDTYVQPQGVVEDYLTTYSGITPEILEENQRPFDVVKEEFSQLVSRSTII
jgi:RNA exonuclease 1